MLLLLRLELRIECNIVVRVKPRQLRVPDLHELTPALLLEVLTLQARALPQLLWLKAELMHMAKADHPVCLPSTYPASASPA